MPDTPERAADPALEDAAMECAKDIRVELMTMGFNGNGMRLPAGHLSAMAEHIAAFAQAAVERQREENAWLRRLLRWCRPRLKHRSYQVWLDKYLEAGVSVVPQYDDPPLVHSGDQP